MAMMVGSRAKVLICIGTGGVGKTTVAASLGALWAEEGLRVLVLTIDPAQRLKTTLGLKEDGTICDIEHPRIRGRLAGAVVHSKNTFDEFVLRAAAKRDSAQKLLRNRLYIQLSTTLSGSQEFTALERLYSAYESNEFDLIVLDTPPAQHAIDFLRAPQKLAALFQEDLVKWFGVSESPKNKFWLSLFQSGTKQVLKTLEFLTGSEFIEELGNFFENIQAWQGTLQERNSAVHRMLVSPTTHFVLIASYDHSKMLEAQKVANEIRRGGYKLTSFIANRASMGWMKTFRPERQEKSSSFELASQWVRYYDERRVRAQVQERIGCFGVDCFELPELDEDVHDLDGVWHLVDFMRAMK